MSLLSIFPLVLLPFSPNSIENRQQAHIAKAEQAYLDTIVHCSKPSIDEGGPAREVFRFSVKDIKTTLEDDFAQVAHSKNFKVVPFFTDNQYSIVIYSGDYSFDVPIPRGISGGQVRLASLSRSNAPIALACYASYEDIK